MTLTYTLSLAYTHLRTVSFMAFIRLSSFTPKKVLKFLGWLCLWILIFVMLVWRWFFFYNQSKLSETNLQEEFWQYFERVEIETYMSWDKSIHYMDIWKLTDQIVFLIHWAPWSITDREAFLWQKELQTWYRFIVVDRLWYWRSNRWQSEGDIGIHAAMYWELLDVVDLTDVIVLWHSYGWPIALLMQRDHPDKIRWSIIVSWAVDPELEKVFGVSYLIKHKPLKRLIWPMLRVANDEKLSHATSLEKNMENLEVITTPTIIIHGTEDSLVPYENTQFLLDRISPNLTTLIPIIWADHPLHFTHPQDIAQALLTYF